jgi:S1-C subfamily serine protease
MTRVETYRKHSLGESRRAPWKSGPEGALGHKAGQSNWLVCHGDGQQANEKLLNRQRIGVCAGLGRLLLLGLLLPALASGGAAATEPTQVEAGSLIRKALPAVVILKAFDRRGTEVSEGTGFLISADGQLVTARHVSEAGRELVAITAAGTRHPVTGFLGDDRDYDVAILKIDGDQYPFLPLAGRLRANQWIGLASHLQKAGLAYSTGSVVRVMDFGGVLKHLVTNIPVQPGQSGSPMLNESGQVVGVLFGSESDSQSDVAPIEVIREILAQPGSTNPLPASKRPRRGRLPVIKDAEFRAGADAMERKDSKEAVRRFSNLARRFPESPLAHVLLGISYREIGSLAYAKGAFAKAVEHKPESSLTWYLYGSTLVTLEKFADAAQALQQSLKIGSSETSQVLSAWSLLATAYAELGDGARAQEAIDNLRRLDAKKADETRTKITKRHATLPSSSRGNEK